MDKSIYDIEVSYVQELGLSAREFEVNKDTAFGYIKKEIADRLCLSIHTIDTYYKRIKGKTGARNIADMTRIFIKANQQMFFTLSLVAIQCASILNVSEIDQRRRRRKGRRMAKVTRVLKVQTKSIV